MDSNSSTPRYSNTPRRSNVGRYAKVGSTEEGSYSERLRKARENDAVAPVAPARSNTVSDATSSRSRYASRARASAPAGGSLTTSSRRSGGGFSSARIDDIDSFRNLGKGRSRSNGGDQMPVATPDRGRGSSGTVSAPVARSTYRKSATPERYSVADGGVRQENVGWYQDPSISNRWKAQDVQENVVKETPARSKPYRGDYGTSRTRLRTDRERNRQENVEGGFRIGDVRKQARNNETVQKVISIALRVIPIIALIIALVLAGSAIKNSTLFTIDSVRVVGANYLSEDTVRQLANVDPTETLLRVDTDAIENSVSKDAWVSSVRVSKKFPSTLEITVVERAVGANVTVPITAQSSAETNWIISSDGVWLAQVLMNATDPTGIKVAEAALTSKLIAQTALTAMPVVGQHCDDPGILNALEILSLISSDLENRIVSISALSVEQTEFTLDNGVVVAFGSADDATSKERVALQLLAEHEGQISYINVRSVDRPAWRGFEG